MSTETDSLLDALQARLGAPAAALAVDVFAAWAAAGATGADQMVAHGCNCPSDHVAHAEHFRHVAEVLRTIYDAKPLTEGNAVRVRAVAAEAEIRAEERARAAIPFV